MSDEHVVSQEPPSADSRDSYEFVESIQRDLVNLLLTDRDFFVRTFSLVEPHYFTQDLHRELMEISRAYFRRYHDTAGASILQEGVRKFHEGDSPDYVESLVKETHNLCQPNETVLKGKEYMMSECLEFAKIQAFKSAIIQSVDALRSKDYGKIESLLRDAMLVAPDVDLGLDYFKDFKERYSRELQERDNEKFTTGVEAFDDALEGGLGKKELGMIYAPPGVGKSLWLVKIGSANLLQDKRVLYFTMEMAEDRIAGRFDSVLTMIPHSERISRFSTLQSRLEEIQKLRGDNLVIKEFPTGQASVSTLRSYLVSLKNFRGWVPDLILLDYADLMQPDHGKGLELWQRQQRIYEEVRGLASEDPSYCIFTASQANRQSRSVPIITENELGDSFGKLRVVDAAWSINVTDMERTRSVGRLFAVKHRNGRSRYIAPVRFDYPTLRILEIEEEQYDDIMKGGDGKREES